MNPEEREGRHDRRGQKRLVDDMLADHSVDTVEDSIEMDPR